MQDLIMLGTGVHGAEMAEIIERINKNEPRWRFLGCLSPDEKEPRKELNGYPVLGMRANIGDYPNANFITDYEWPKTLPVPMDRLVSIIDPSSFVSRTAVIGRGCVVYPHCYIGLNARLGDYVFMLSGCIVNHDNVIGDRCTLASGVVLAGGVKVEAGCYIGQMATIRGSLNIGANSLVGMGAVVVKDVPPNSVMVGNPARKLKDRT